MRLTCSLICLLAASLNHLRVVRPYAFWFCLLVTAALSTLTTFAGGVMLAEQHFSLGHTMILGAALALLPLGFWRAMLLGSTATLGYAVPTLLRVPTVELMAFQIQLGLMGALTLVLSVGAHLNQAERARAFELRAKLSHSRHRHELTRVGCRAGDNSRGGGDL